MATRRLDHAREKRKARARAAARQPDEDPRESYPGPPALRGCRDHWDGEPFPVVTTYVEANGKQVGKQAGSKELGDE